jgi:hypothetical protein
MSVAVFQGVSVITSGLVRIGTPTSILSLAYLESVRVRTAEIPKLNIWEPYIAFPVVHEDVVKFDIFNLRFSEMLEDISRNYFTCIYRAIFMEHLQCFKYTS